MLFPSSVLNDSFISCFAFATCFFPERIVLKYCQLEVYLTRLPFVRFSNIFLPFERVDFENASAEQQGYSIENINTFYKDNLLYTETRLMDAKKITC